MKTLASDVIRCAGRMNFYPDNVYCDQRNTCQRFLAWMVWDRNAGIKNYSGIEVTMMRYNCEDKIEC